MWNQSRVLTCREAHVNILLTFMKLAEEIWRREEKYKGTPACIIAIYSAIYYNEKISKTKYNN